MLKEISSAGDVKKLNMQELGQLAEDLREEILSAVSRNGGHLASNLGIVELTIALHRVFDSPDDQIVFDVGHQCYAHKMLTGRREAFSTLRQAGGLSGFTNPKESAHDPFIAGHSGPSIAAALGIAEANKRLGSDHFAVAVVGDGSFTNGMIYEALNSCGGKALNLVIILNDNKMSISQNVGGLSKYFSRIRTSTRYISLKHRLKRFFGKLPGGKGLIRMARAIKNFIRRILMRDNLFECLGLDYLGPVDGHDIGKLEEILREAKTKEGVCIVHAVTQKGKGYSIAEEVPELYHGVGPFNREEGIQHYEKPSFSAELGRLLCEHADKDERICAITAAMCEGAGLSRFHEKYPDRLYDVGIAEEAAVAFAGGLLKKGLRPVCVLYSTFAQRVYDQMLHDIVLQKLPLILALDRSGIVPRDGITHQGIFDAALFSSIPGVKIYTAETYTELEEAFEKALCEQEAPVLIRYAKGTEREYDRSGFRIGETLDYTETEADKAVITYGRITGNAVQAAGDSARVIKLKRIFPIDREELKQALSGVKKVLIAEEGIRSGGICEKLALICAEEKIAFRIHAIEGFLEHGDIASLDRICGFDTDSLKKEIEEL